MAFQLLFLFGGVESPTQATEDSKILGLKKEKYASTKKSRRLEDSSQIDISGSRNGNFDAYRHSP